MRKLLIVEDEASARNGLAELLRTLPFSLEIAVAEDGEDGYETALEFQPDIIISDIKMPGIDGLAMIEKLREQEIQSKVILLTGFAEFGYAQSAVRAGVSDYILKPVVPSQLLSRVRSLLEELEREQQKREEALQRSSRLYLMSEEDLPSFQEQIEALGYTDVFCAVVYLRGADHLPGEAKAELKEIPNLHLITLADRRYRGILLGFADHRMHYSAISRLEQIMESYPVTCIYQTKKSSQVNSWLQEFRLLEQQICWAVTYDSSFFSFSPEMQKEAGDYHISSVYKKELQQKYYDRDYAGCLEYILKHLQQMQKERRHPKEILFAATASIMNVFTEQKYLVALGKCTEAKTMEEIAAVLKEFLETGEQEGEDAPYSRLVQSAVSFIHQSYGEAISLSVAAEKLSITPQYLSKLFMQETSQTFMDYLMGVRMEQAKILLAKTNQQINVIGAKVGYPDPKYFCTSFRKCVGLTPNQYRKSCNRME